MIAILSRRLSQRERTILEYLAEGRGAREIATKLKVTHPCVIKYRRKIAALALKLGIGRPPQNHANGKSSNGNGKSRRAVAV
jgi:ATP/maltotriose-dependent transcriptional regulator MalT